MTSRSATPGSAPPRLAAPGFGARVRQRFARSAALYEAQALLQRSIAARLGRLCRELPLPPGPCADLGAGTGLLSRSLGDARGNGAGEGLLQLDLCPELLARNPLPRQRAWDLNAGLPAELDGAALLASSFALQWLERPGEELGRWCRGLRPGGWLVLALPTAGSFPQWRRAARAAAVPCTALGLPEAGELLGVARREGLRLRHGRVLRFTRPRQGGLATLRHLDRLGAGASRRQPLAVGELRRLLRHWPASTPLTWEVLLLVGQRPC